MTASPKTMAELVPEQLIASIAKNSREVLRIEMSGWHGSHFVNLRCWFLNEAGALCPGRQGIALSYRDLPKIIEALETAYNIATARGLA
jgi:hypothetical protein